MTTKRSAFFVSDRTGITAEVVGHSLLTQFDELEFNETTLPFIDTPEKVEEAVQEINQAARRDGVRPIVISTLVGEAMSALLTQAEALVLDCFQIFIAPLEQELGMKSSHAVGRSHSAVNSSYFRRIEAVNFALSYDDGQATRELVNADVVLVGVSRCGKTPTCLYLALQYGIRAANYPLIPEDFGTMRLPGQLQPCRNKLFGPTILPDRLHQIRSERRPAASTRACKLRVGGAQPRRFCATRLFLLDTTIAPSKSWQHHSASRHLARHIY
jgi:regulator of PEP synthase PpsR (kinase-PPPase family)